ncbi:MAG: arginase [Minwuia sp.]|nr:arginase [Minwuia sp.]
MQESQTRKIAILGAPVDSGASLRGCQMGPDAMRIAGLGEALQELGHEVRDFGNAEPAPLAREVPERGRARNIAMTAAWTESLMDHASRIADAGWTPIFVGGDHSLAIGTVAGVARHAASQGRELFVLWLDAHADFNTLESSESGHTHGMPVAMFCGIDGAEVYGAPLENPVNPRNVTMMGIRSVDEAEHDLVLDNNIDIHDMRAVDEIGFAGLTRAFIDRVRAANGLLHVSLDVDFLDPDVAPGVGTTVPGGATVREAHLIMELLHDSGLVTSVDLAEINPYLDDRGKTARLMRDLTASLFGRRVMGRPPRRR